jgi:hypothetical protein
VTEVLLFHHALGLAPLDDGLAHAREIGLENILERSIREADDLPADLVYAGFSLGEMAAQKLAQTRPGARGALLFYSCIPISGEWAFGPWPDGVPVQIHGMDADPIFVGEGDIEAARGIVGTVEDADLFLYPGTSTTSPTARSRRTTRTPPRCSPGGCSSSWTPSGR